uniref:Reverse transcriptase domain-containing protein n=1 Tax=Manihot esculenta TaxID=3983 RepID=A0A2C9V409_MANES
MTMFSQLNTWQVLRCPKISHLFFADDSLIFFNARLEEADSIKSILNTYAAASGQVSQCGLLYKV